jgi:hypothetical protein
MMAPAAVLPCRRPASLSTCRPGTELAGQIDHPENRSEYPTRPVEAQLQAKGKSIAGQPPSRPAPNNAHDELADRDEQQRMWLLIKNSVILCVVLYTATPLIIVLSKIVLSFSSLQVSPIKELHQIGNLNFAAAIGSREEAAETNGRRPRRRTGGVEAQGVFTVSYKKSNMPF